MIGQQITLERMAHVTNRSVNQLAASRIDDRFHNYMEKATDDYMATGDTRLVTVDSFGADKKGRNPWVAVRFGDLVTFRLNSGCGETRVRDYRIDPKDLEKLRKHATEVLGFKLVPDPKREQPHRRPVKAPKEQAPLFGGER